MTYDDAQFDRLQDLCGAVRDGDATAETVVELERLLAASAEMRQYYVDLMFVQAAMERQECAEEDSPSAIGNGEGVGFRVQGSDTAEDEISKSPNLQIPNPVPFPVLASPISSLPSLLGSLSHDWPLAYLIATVIFGIGLLIGSLTQVSEPVQVARQSVPLPSRLSPLPADGLAGLPAWSIAGGNRVRKSQRSRDPRPKTQDPRLCLATSSPWLPA